jgi:tetratricopeptide (TPR) repeat protein
MDEARDHAGGVWPQYKCPLTKSQGGVMNSSSWSAVELEAARAIRERRHQVAISLLSEFLRVTSTPLERREALAMRGTLLCEVEQLEAAEKDLRAAHSLSDRGEYARYTIELLLGQLTRRQGREAEARDFYLGALRTVTEGSGLSAGSALESVASALRESTPSDAEQALIREAVRRSWEVLHIEAPIPTSIDECVRRIRERERAAG